MGSSQYTFVLKILQNKVNGSLRHLTIDTTIRFWRKCWRNTYGEMDPKNIAVLLALLLIECATSPPPHNPPPTPVKAISRTVTTNHQFLKPCNRKAANFKHLKSCFTCATSTVLNLSPIFPLIISSAKYPPVSNWSNRSSYLRGRQQLFMGVLFVHWTTIRIGTQLISRLPSLRASWA